MSVNLLCDKYEEERKNPTIIIEPDAMYKVQNKTSKYTGVTWDQSYKKIRKWKARLIHNKKSYSCGYFHHEKEAAMSVNFLCDKLGIKRKNPNKDAIQEKTKEFKEENIVKIEDESIIFGLKDKCENNVIKSKDKKVSIVTELYKSQKRKRKKDLFMKDAFEENMLMSTPYRNGNELLEKLQKDDTKIHKHSHTRKQKKTFLINGTTISK
jgi:hypothetical protein